MTAVELASSIVRAQDNPKMKSVWDGTNNTWTIGFGHTRMVSRGDEISLSRAIVMLDDDLLRLSKFVQGKPLLEAASLLVFGHACGEGALQRVLSGHSRLENFIKTGGVVSEKQIARRKLESALIEVSKESGGAI